MKKRRLVVADSDYSRIKQIRLHDQIDLTGIRNASACDPIHVVVEEECNLGCWHKVSHTDLPCWGDD